MTVVAFTVQPRKVSSRWGDYTAQDIHNPNGVVVESVMDPTHARQVAQHYTEWAEFLARTTTQED